MATVTRRIDQANSLDPSTVFGLVGPWGSGKSSVIERVRSELPSDWVIGEFTPWSSADSSAMAIEFVNTLADALGSKVSGSTRAKLARYAGLATPLLRAIPVVGSGVEGTVSGALTAIGNMPPWRKQFEELASEVGDIGKRVLIVVDDVDRLTGDELLTLLKIVRLLGRFNGVHYLIAYDQETVEDLLATTGAIGHSSSFMEKIVQYPFEIPPISPGAALRLMNKVVDEVLALVGVKLDEEGVVRSVELVGTIANFLETPRRLGRLREQLRTFSNHAVEAELDPLDYIAITWLRLTAHGVWAELPEWRAELESGQQYESLTKNAVIPEAEWMNRIRSADPRANVAATGRTLAFLFPGVTVRGMSYFMTHSRALTHESYFSRYMVLALPEGDVSDQLIGSVVEALAHGAVSDRGAELAEVFDGPEERAYLAYSRANSMRRAAQSTDRDLLEYLHERLEARNADAPAVGAPRNTLRVWIAHEIAVALSSNTLSAQEVIEIYGEDDTFSFARAAMREAHTVEAKTLMVAGFADYWLSEIEDRGEELREIPGRLGQIADLVLFAKGADSLDGKYDWLAQTFEEYVQVAESFVQIQTWVGSDTSYTTRFRSEQFAVALSVELRAAYADAVSEARTGLFYQTEDLPSPDLPSNILREFTLASLQAVGQ